MEHLAEHRGTVFQMFREGYGLSPRGDPQSRRTQQALTLSREMPLSIQTVPILSGFIEPNDFAKCIKRLSGMSPRGISWGELKGP